MSKRTPKPSQTSKPSVKPITFYYTPVSAVLCQDVLTEKNDLVSLFRLIDSATATLPTRFLLWFVGELACNDGITETEFQAAEISLELRLRNPESKNFTLVSMTPTKHTIERTLTIQRFMIDLTGAILFQNEGKYTFELWGRVLDGEFELLLSRWLNVKAAKAGETIIE